MAWTERYANFDLTTGNNDGTSEANAWQTFASMTAGVTAGNRVNIKKQASPYQNTSSITCSVNGTATAPIYYRGYENTIGDDGMWVVAQNSGGASGVVFGGAFNYVEGMAYIAGASTNFGSMNPGGWTTRCYITIFNTSLLVTNASNCYFELVGDNSSVQMVGTNSANSYFINNKIRKVSGTTAVRLISFDMFARTVQFIGNSLIGNSSTNGIEFGRATDGRGVLIYGNRFYNCNSAIVLANEPNALREDFHICNNIFSTMAAYGVSRTDTEGGYTRLSNNFYHNCTSGLTNYSEEAEMWGKNTSLASSPFVSTTDLTINETTSGQTVRDSGFPVLESYDYTNMISLPVYEGPTPAEIAQAVWTRTGRSTT
jgi:hypothetical protein